MNRTIIVLGTLISLLTGCFRKPEPPPEKPGVSVELKFPVVVMDEFHLEIRDDEKALITTSVVSALSVYSMKILDSDGLFAEVRKATPFGMKSVWLDAGRTPYQVYLDLKQPKKIDLKKAKAEVTAVYEERARRGSTAEETERARAAIQKCNSITELIEACRKTLRWI